MPHFEIQEVSIDERPRGLATVNFTEQINIALPVVLRNPRKACTSVLYSILIDAN